MDPISVELMYKADEKAIKELGISQKTLMENAGQKVFDAVVSFWGCPSKVTVLCGKGNNGGDAKIASEHFKNFGATVDIIDANMPNAITMLERSLQNTELVVDGLFGIGLNKEISGDNETLISIINDYKISKINPRRQNYRVVSIDIPSGLNANTGEIMGVCINADLTVTFHAPKVGMLTSNGINRCGRIVVADIGIPYFPEHFLVDSKITFADHNYVKRVLKYRKTYSNKSDNGKLLVFAASQSMAGASILCSKSAIRSGAGLVYLFVPQSLQTNINVSVPEGITLSYDDIKNLQKIDFTSFIAGPGIGTKSKNLLKSLIKATKSCPMLLDADALNIISEDSLILNNLNRKIVLTPHPGEMSRLLKMSVEDIQNDRISAAYKAAEKYNSVVVLKGLNTVVAEPFGRCCIVSAGNPALACGGSGDVLSGIIGAIMAQGVDIFDAAVTGSFIHGMCADIVRSLKGETGVSPLDIIEAIPYFIKGCCDGKPQNN